MLSITRSTLPARLAAVTAALALPLAAAATAQAASPVPPSSPAGTQVERTGTLVELVADDFDRGEAHSGFGLQGRGPGELIPLTRISEARAHRWVGKPVRVSGALDARGQLVVADGGLAADTAGTTADSGTSTPGTTKKVAVVLVNFADSPTTPVTHDSVRSLMSTSTNGVNAYYQDVSDGTLGITGDVFGYYTVTRSSTTTCDFSTWGNAARSAAVNSGVDLSGYDNLMYVWPRQSACSWSGMGSMPGSNSWINGSPALRVMAHELGHNFGQHHATTARCTENGSAVMIPSSSATCTLTEYGDPFTLMGASNTNMHHNAARAHFGFITPTTVTPGVDASYTLAPADSTVGTRLVRIPRGDGSYLALEFRQPTAPFDTFSSSAPVANGVSVRIDYGKGTLRTRILDATPSTSSFADAPLLAGQSVTDPLSGATLSVTSVTSTGAQVRVSFGGGAGDPGTEGPGPDVSAPSTPTGLSAAVGSTSTGAQVKLTWNASSDDVGVTGYRVRRNGTLLSTVTTPGFTDSAVAAGASYTYTVTAVDAAGNESGSASTTAVVPSSDTISPSNVTRLKASVNKNRVVKLSWGAASDNVRVSDYVVSRSGAADRVVTTTSHSEQMSTGTHTFTVRARDAAGNLSSGVTVTVTVR